MNPTPASNGRLAGAASTLSFTLPVAGGQLMLDTTGVPWIDGAGHPIDEFYHIAALLLLGVAAAMLGGRSRWGLPAMFAALLAFGIILGTQGAVAPMLDTIVMTTALALVLLIMGKVHVIFATITSIIGAFALFHGVADGFAMHTAKLGVDYMAGYAIANIAILFIGVIIGDWVHRHTVHWNERMHRMLDHLRGWRHV